MGYQRDNGYRGGDDRWRDRDREGDYRGERGQGRGGWTGSQQGGGYQGGGYQDRGGQNRGYGDDDRGFIDRAGDEVRSWFGDEEAERRRERDRLREERERGWDNNRSFYQRGSGGRESSWGGRDDDRGRTGSYDRGEARGGYGYGGGYAPGSDRGSRGEETWGGFGSGGDIDRGRRFDRIDAGSTGTHGAHPMASAAGGAGAGVAYGAHRSSSGAVYEASQRSQDRSQGGRGLHDPHYSEWRRRQLDELDRDYDDYCREHQSKFEQEFGGWRQQRQTQRQALSRVTEHMEVVGSDGKHVGTVDKVRGDRIILTKADPNAGGHHHSIPCSWVDRVEDKVVINKSAEQAIQAWRDEETSRALFEREDQGSDGPHILDRSFPGTY